MSDKIRFTEIAVESGFLSAAKLSERNSIYAYIQENTYHGELYGTYRYTLSVHDAITSESVVVLDSDRIGVLELVANHYLGDWDEDDCTVFLHIQEKSNTTSLCEQRILLILAFLSRLDDTK
jgi:hypothetical protein